MAMLKKPRMAFSTDCYTGRHISNARCLYVVCVIGGSIMTWSHFAHGADIGLRGGGKCKVQAFEEIARALTAAVTDPELVAAEESISLCCEAPSDEILLVDWLNALIYEMAVRQMLFSDFSVSITGGVLRAEVAGEPVDRDKHHPAVEVKGATYTALAVEETDAGWVVQCVVDV
jgi:tRNA nucleotidyltransferase (CCA-adding enzyme)